MTAEVTGVQVRSNGANTTEDFIVLLSEKYSGQSGTADSSRNTKSKVKIFMSPDDTTGKYLTEVCGGWWSINYWECGGGLFLIVDNYSSYNGTTIYKITIEAGCELPCGDVKYVTTEDVTWYNLDFGNEAVKDLAVHWSNSSVKPEMTNGAAVRLGTMETSGLRFETTIEKSQLSVLQNLYEKVEFGMLIVPADYLTDGTEFTMESLSAAGKNYLDIPSTGFVNAEDEVAESYRYYGSIVNIKASNYTRDFAGIGYIKLTSGEVVSYIYADYDEGNIRNIYEVSRKAYEDKQSEKDDTYQYTVGDMYSRYTSEQLAILKAYIDGVVTVTVEDGKSVVFTIE